MSLNEIVGKALLRVKMDTTQAKSELKSLRGAEAQAARARLTEAEQYNRGIDKQIAMYGKLLGVVGAGVAAYKIAQTSANAYMEDLRLRSAAAGANIDALRTATIGLIEEDKLLAFAGKAQAGVWKLNQQELESVLKGATALRKTMGVDLTETIDKLTESLAKGSTRALKDFGIEAKDKQDAIRKMDELFASLHGNVGLAGDAMTRSGIQIKDAFGDMQEALGELTMSLAPFVSELAKAISLIAEGVRAIAENKKNAVDSTNGGFLNETGAWVKGVWGSIYDIGPSFGSGDELWGYDKSLMGGAKAEMALLQKQLGGGGPNAAEMMLRSRFGNLMFSGDGSATAQRNAEFWKLLNGLKASRGGAGGRGAGGIDVLDLEARGFRDNPGDAMLDDMIGDWAAERAAQERWLKEQKEKLPKFGVDEPEKSDQTKYLEKMIGTPAEIDAVTESLKLATTAFDGLTTAVTAGFDAWITGQGSVVSAFNNAIGEMMRSLAKQMLVESLKHTAMGFGMLAFPDPTSKVSAGAHFKAAGLFAGVAVAAGVAAKGIGAATGQWSHASAGSGSSSPSRTISNNSAGSGDGNTTIVYVGAEWAAMSKIEQANGIRNAIRLGKRGSRHVRRN
jgi:hypothetical protein